MTVTIDKEALRRKYLEERRKRLRPDGNDQYIRISTRFPEYLVDPYLPVVEREPKTDHVTMAFIGAGFAGLLTGARVKEAGVGDVRLIDRGGDFGGTWYWNRYPGAQCDTAALVYMPLLEETGHMPSEKYAHGPEILEHCRRIGRQYDLYEDALFHTEVTDLRWDDERQAWRLWTNRGDDFTAQFVGVGVGPLHVPKLPGIPGIEDFRGHAFHTSRWDYDYTGGDPDGAPLAKLADKRVAIIGTGATAIQCIPHLGRDAGHLYVFQRTPSSVDVRDNRPLDPAWFASIATPGWQQRWLENFTDNQAGGLPTEDLVMDGWTDIARRIRDQILANPPEELSAETLRAAYEDADFAKMEEIRARVDAIVQDRDTAARLKAWYRQLCKRPCFHDEYLQTYNRPNVTLVDTDGRGVERITEHAVVVDGVEYEVDCIVYASGFEFGIEFTERAGFDVVGRDGLRLDDHWKDGMRSLHGLQVHGFPNLFFVQPVQGANLISNVPHNLSEAARTIAAEIAHLRANGLTTVEVSQEAEDEWVSLLLTGLGQMLVSNDCTPGYYNNEGQIDEQRVKYLVGYPLGASEYFRYLDAWRSSGRFEGLEFGREPSRLT
ncbi:MAG TPA: NAD(P)/FAD-dependent oxidoreductase [Candidatus Dormibacteraeota bacterium]